MLQRTKHHSQDTRLTDDAYTVTITCLFIEHLSSVSRCYPNPPIIALSSGCISYALAVSTYSAFAQSGSCGYQVSVCPVAQTLYTSAPHGHKPLYQARAGGTDLHHAQRRACSTTRRWLTEQNLRFRNKYAFTHTHCATPHHPFPFPPDLHNIGIITHHRRGVCRDVVSKFGDLALRQRNYPSSTLCTSLHPGLRTLQCLTSPPWYWTLKLSTRSVLIFHGPR
jgi:hypothetical protein